MQHTVDVSGIAAGCRTGTNGEITVRYSVGTRTVSIPRRSEDAIAVVGDSGIDRHALDLVVVSSIHTRFSLATRTYLRGESGVKASRDHPIKQTGWAQLQLIYDRAQSLTYRVLSELRADPRPEELRRAHVATVTTMESAPEMASLALRTCGGRSLLRPGRLEQHYRDARCGATMLPWSTEELLVRLGRNGLYDDLTDDD